MIGLEVKDMEYIYTFYLKDGKEISFTRKHEEESHENYVETFDKAFKENNVIKIAGTDNEPKWRMIPASSVSYLEFEEI